MTRSSPRSHRQPRRSPDVQTAIAARSDLNVSVSIRPSTADDSAVVRAGRDAESTRILGVGVPDPGPSTTSPAPSAFGGSRSNLWQRLDRLELLTFVSTDVATIRIELPALRDGQLARLPESRPRQDSNLRPSD